MNGARRFLLPALMAFEAATLVLMSSLHLAGILDDGSQPFDRVHAGIAEAIIALVLVGGAAAALRAKRVLAAASVAFALVGFGIGLSFTIRGGAAASAAYHVTVLPLLVGTLVPLVRISYRRSRTR